MKIKYAIINEPGPRSKNEDSVCVIDRPADNQWLGVLCDGLGGHSMGDVASSTVCDAVCDYYQQHFDDGDAAARAYKACRSAGAKLDKRAFSLNHVEMGTTLVLAGIEGNTITIAHCGDSRCYLMRDGQLLHQTKDHIALSFGWEIVSNCFFSYKNANTKPEIAQFELKPGDRILLCSDGLYKSMPPEILMARMWDDKTPEELLDVYAFLCEKNADDNYTAILAIVG